MADNQQGFFNTYRPYAEQAGKALGVAPEIILGQWAHETGFGTNRGTAHNNLGGFTAPDGNYFSYKSPQEFTDHYIATLQNRYPGSVGAGSDAGRFASGLQAGGYFTGDPKLTPAQNLQVYTNGVSRNAQLAGLTPGQPAGASDPLSALFSAKPPPAPTAAPPAAAKPPAAAVVPPTPSVAAPPQPAPAAVPPAIIAPAAAATAPTPPPAPAAVAVPTRPIPAPVAPPVAAPVAAAPAPVPPPSPAAQSAGQGGDLGPLFSTAPPPAPPAPGTIDPLTGAPTQSVTQGTAPTWWQRNVGMPVASMLRPDLPAGQGQNYLLGMPALQSLGAGTVQGARDVAQTLAGWGEAANARYPQLAAIDRYLGFPAQTTLPQQTAAYEQQYPSDVGAQAARIAGNIGMLANTPLASLARGARYVGEAVPWVGRILGPAAEGAVGGAGQNVLTSPDQNPLTAATTGAIGGGLVGGALGGVGRVFTGPATATTDMADRLGVPLSAGDRQGLKSMAKGLEDTTTPLPFSGAGKLADQQRGAITRNIAKEAGIPGPIDHIDTPFLNQQFQRVGQNIDNAALRINVPSAGTNLMTDLATIERDAISSGPGTPQAYQFRNLSNRILNDIVSGGGAMSGTDFQRFITRGGELDNALKSGDPDVRRIAGRIREALFDAAQSGGQGSADALRDLGQARYQWKVLSTVAPAIQRTAAGSDEMSLPALANAIRGEFNMSGTGPGNNMQDLARLISGPLRSLPSSGTAERTLRQNLLLGGGLLGAGGGAGGLGYLAGSPHAADLAALAAVPTAATIAASRLSRFGPGLGISPLEAARQAFNPLAPRLLGPAVGANVTPYLPSAPQIPQLPSVPQGGPQP